MPTIRKPKRTKTTKTILLDLPSDILLSILTQLNHNDRLTLLLVSKPFKSLIDVNFIRQLKFDIPPSNSTFRKLFSRFTSVNHVALKYKNYVNGVILGRSLVEISRSQLKIESLEISGQIECLTPRHFDILLQSDKFKMVKVLKLNWCVHMEFSGFKFIRLFPFLQELDCEHCYLDDARIEILALKAPNLRKINLEGNFLLTDLSLNALGNCVYLEDVSLASCHRITLRGLSAFTHKRKNLKSLNFPNYPFEQVEDDVDNSVLKLAETISNCENLTHISISNGLMRDDFLTIIANSHSALTSLRMGNYGLGFAEDYTIKGVSVMLRAYQGLTKLHLFLPWYNSTTYDTKMSILVKSLPRLKDVFIFSRFPSYATLFSLIQNCSVLEEIYLNSVDNDRSIRYETPRVLRKNYSIQKICLVFLLPYYFHLGTDEKEAIKSSCPALKILDCDDDYRVGDWDQ